MKKIFYLIPFILVFAVIGFFYGKKKTKTQEVHPRKGPIVESIYGLGTVQSDNIFTLKLGVTTRIKKVFVKEGENVIKGQQLLQFDEEGVQSQYAPFAGSVTQINYFAGETVFPQAPILTVMDLKNRYISVALDQEGALRVRPKQKVFLSFESIENKSIEGSVRTIFPRQGQLVAHIEATNLPPEVLPGMTADVAVVVGEKNNATLLPIKAIHQGSINVIESNKPVPITVKLGIVDAEWAEILSPDLKETDTVEVPSE